MDYSKKAPFLVGYWMDQCGRINESGNYDPSVSLTEDQWPHVELAGNDVELAPLTMTQYGSITQKTQASWHEGPYEFRLTRPGNTALVLEVRKDGVNVGSCAFWADEEGNLKLVMPKGLCENQEFVAGMVSPVMREAEEVARAWHHDIKLINIARADQSVTRTRELRHQRGEISAEEQRTITELNKIDLESESPDFEM